MLNSGLYTVYTPPRMPKTIELLFYADVHSIDSVLKADILRFLVVFLSLSRKIPGHFLKL